MDGLPTFNIPLGPALIAIAAVITSIFRPVTRVITLVADSGWFGLVLVFMIFFTLLLIRFSARTGKHVIAAEALEYLGARGLVVCAGYLAVLCVEYALMPPLTLMLTLIFNSLTGVGEPGISGFLNFMTHASPARTAFLGDLVGFYRRSHTILPLGFRTAGLITAAALCMFMVGRALGKRRGAVDPAPRPPVEAAPARLVGGGEAGESGQPAAGVSQS